MMASYLSNDTFWKSFFQMYRGMPELWQTSCEAYKSKEKKILAWDRLLEKYKEQYAAADLYSLKKKTHNIRSCVGREFRKIKRSIVNGGDPKTGTVYRPNLWYYYELTFLKEQSDDSTQKAECYGEDDSDIDEEFCRPSTGAKRIKPNMDSEDDTSYFGSSETDTMFNSRVAIQQSTSEPLTAHHSDDDYAGSSKIPISHETNNWSSSDGPTISVNEGDGCFVYTEISQKKEDNTKNLYHSSGEERQDDANSHTKKNLNIKQEENTLKDALNVENIRVRASFVQPPYRDEAVIYAEGWATSYRKLSNTQRSMARKAIEEIFFLGEMEQLTPGVVRMPRL